MTSPKRLRATSSVSLKAISLADAPAAAIRHTLALSDLHLGRVITHARAPEIIAPLVEGFDRVLLLGDIVDHWYTSASEARNYETRIRKVCAAAGVKQVVYFRGNHDACMEEARSSRSSTACCISTATPSTTGSRAMAARRCASSR
jgi:UDP-2,3-diacylglucosamine pyrophosphatase LpxH